MTDSTLTKRLRELAEHRAKILGKAPEDMEEWKAASTIEALRESLELEKSNSSFWKRKYTEDRHRRSRR